MKKGKILCTGILGSIGIAAGLISILYRMLLVPKGYSWLYPWMEPTGLLCLVAAVFWLIVLWIPFDRGQKLLTFFLITFLLFAGFFWWISRLPEQVQIRRSPAAAYSVVIVENSAQQSSFVYRIYERFWKKQKEQLPFAPQQELKYQWLQEDACAITGVNQEGNFCQYVATFGDRGSGISYLDPFAAMGGDWAVTALDGAAENTGVTAENKAAEEEVHLQIGSTIELQVGSKRYVYDSSECERYGTIAITLGKGREAAWTLVMNQDCHLVNDQIAAGGTLTLCRVSQKQTEAVVLQSLDEREVWNGQEDIPAEKDSLWDRIVRKFQRTRQETEKSIFGEMRLLAENHPEGEGYAPRPDGTFFVRTTEEDISWNLRNILKEYRKCYRQNGMDYWVQMDAVRCLAGDQKEGAYQVMTTQLVSVPGIHGQLPTVDKGAQTFTFRLVRTAQGYYVHPCHWQTDATWDLEKAAEETTELSHKSEYQFFLTGISSTEGQEPDLEGIQEESQSTAAEWEFVKAPEEGMEELYREWLQEAYPRAKALLYEDIPGMQLTEEGLFLLYDGITEDGLHYRYRIVKAEGTELKSDTKLYTQAAYQVAMKRGMSDLAEVEMPKSISQEENPEDQKTTAEEKAEDGGSSVGKDADASGTPAPREQERLWLTSSENFEKEYVLEEPSIVFRMIVLDAAAGSRLYGLLKSYDNGLSWYIVEAEAEDRLFGGGIDFSFINEDLGFAVVSHNGGTGAELWITEDGGLHYSRVELEAHYEILPNGETFQPYDFPKLPYFEDGVCYVLCGQGADGDFDGGDQWTLARYRSEDGGKTFLFDQLVPGTGTR